MVSYHSILLLEIYLLISLLDIYSTHMQQLRQLLPKIRLTWFFVSTCIYDIQIAYVPSFSYTNVLGVRGVVTSWSIPLHIILWKHLRHNLPHHLFFSLWFSISVLHLLKTSNTSSLCLSRYTQQLLLCSSTEETNMLIYKGNKVSITINSVILKKTTNIWLNNF